MRKLFVLLLVIGALLLVLWSTQQRPGEQHVVSVPVLAGHRLDEASVIRWQEAGKTMIEARREPDGRWWLREPIVDLCSRAFLVAIASAFDSAMMAEAALPAGADPQQQLADTGLLPPAITFTGEFPDGKVDLEIGGEGIFGSERFLRRNGVIYQGSNALFSALQVTSEDLRERQVFRGDPATVNSVAVDNLQRSGPRELFRIERQGDGFRMTSPVVSRTDRALAQRYLDLLLRMRIDQFPASVARFPDDRPADVVVDIDGSFGKEHVEFWRDPQDRLLGRLDDRKLSFVVLDTQYHAIFDNAAAALRARWLLPLEQVQEVTRVVVDPGPGRGERLLLERSGGGFRLAEPVLAQTSPTPVNELLQALNNCRVIEFVAGKGSEPQFGLQPALSVLVTGARGETVTLKFGADSKRGEFDVTFCVRADEPDQVVTVPAAAVQQLRRVWTDYVAKEALLIQGAVGQLHAVRSKGDGDRTWRLRDGRWQRDQDNVPLPTPDVVNDGIKDLVGERVFGARQMALGEPDWTLQVARENGDRLASIRVWDRGKDQPLLVQPSNQPELVYEAKDWVGDFLRALWRD